MRTTTLALLALFSCTLAAAALAANPKVDLETTAGTIKLELYPKAAPVTVDNFLQYVKSGHYDGTQFHRVIKGFMIQGGGYDVDFKEKPTRPPIVNEAAQSLKAGLKNEVGTISMARMAAPNSASAQFFINVADNPALDPNPSDPVVARGAGYCVFGKVVAGMDVVNKIATSPTGSGGMFPTDVPVTRVVIKKATVEPGS